MKVHSVKYHKIMTSGSFDMTTEAALKQTSGKMVHQNSNITMLCLTL